MNIQKTFKYALIYPFTSAKNLFILLILNLGLLFAGNIGPNSFFDSPLASILFILLSAALTLFTSGYLISIVKSTLDHSNEMPDFKDWIEMGWDGLRFIVVSFVYNLPLIPLYIIPFLFAPDAAPSTSLVSFIMPVSYMTLLLTSFLLSVFTFMALGNMAHKRTISAAFQTKEILKLIKKISWKTYLSYALIYAIIINIISLVQDLTSYWWYPSDYGVIVFIVWGLINAYLLAFQGRVIGSVYLKTQEDEIED